MKPKVWIGLVLINAIWSANPIALKVMMEEMRADQAAWSRCFFAFILLLCIETGLRLRDRKKRVPASKDPEISRKNWAKIFSIAGTTYFFTPLLLTLGLDSSQATDNALLIALEPLITSLMAWLLLNERPTRTQLSFLVFAVVGFLFLSRVLPLGATHPESLNQRSLSLWLANVLIVLALFGDAIFSVSGKSLSQQIGARRALLYSLGLGASFLTVWLVCFSKLPSLTKLSATAVLATIWVSGPGTALGYLYWLRVSKSIPIAAMVLTLFVQPLLGMVWGGLLLHESLTGWQFLGGALILLTVAVAPFREKEVR